MESVKIGLIGLGTIGGGVYDAIISNRHLIARKTGVLLEVKGVCDKDIKVLKKIKCSKNTMKTTSPEDLIRNSEIDIIVELIGGVHPAKEIILKALCEKKHIVTANKALLSEHWKEIFSLADKNQAFVNFEASVGGAIPIIRTLRESFVPDNINTIYGILNGTTNFILTKMEEGFSFGSALKIAREKGIAEKNAELDISGMDSAHKLAILSLLSFGIDVSCRDVYVEGIRGIAVQDIQTARRWGYSVKLLAIAKNTSRGLELKVHPTLLPSSHILSDVRGTDNAIFIKGDIIGESLLFGKGAGRKPTSNSVISDIIEIAKHTAFVGKNNPIPYNFGYSISEKKMRRIDKMLVSCYLRFSVIDKPGVLASISSILARYDISIANVSQEERNKGKIVPVVILTHKAEEGNMRKAIARIDQLDCVSRKTVVIRIEE